ncbi:50S ribosomal protein L34 [Candidatus Dojkabacteria bacterium]|uniref:Large ribosomal subunit protein bL34 n=1 Tax=Candidatus Dojkabacteria bacterium TaxID=2099670 RepID=A0A955LB18_9BACT|nr:50S ribosomal protein L34 [Candidatus Dojkabacteria bacterium]
MAKQQGPTYQPSKIKRIRKFGFLARSSKWTGRNVLKRRRVKGRAKLTASTDFGTKMEKDKKFKRRK